MDIIIFLLVAFINLLSVFADDATVTNEVTLTINVADYRDSGNEKNVTMEMALFGEVAPMSVMNYLGLCKGYQKKGPHQTLTRHLLDQEECYKFTFYKHVTKLLHYVGTPVHRIVPDFVVQMGDVENKDGSGGLSIYGKHFDDEEFHMRHQSRGYLAMANTGPNSNGSQFYITLVRARWLDRSHVVFGKVIKGMEALEELGEIPSSRTTARPKKNITIIDCYENNIDRKWIMTEEQLYSDEDIKL